MQAIVRTYLKLYAAALGVSAPVVLGQQIPITGETYAHDPSTIVQEGSTFYYYCTGQGILSRQSTDLSNWSDGPAVFSTAPAWSTTAVPGFTGDFWAPDVSYFDGLYHMYYAVSTFGSQVSAIGMATSPTLNPSASNYQWTDQGPVIESQTGDAYNTIDPSIITATNGTMWMSFGSYWTGIYEIQLNPGTGLVQSGASPIHLAQRAGSDTSDEASYLYYHDGYYYVFSNWGMCCMGTASTYNVRMGRSTSVNGPFVDESGTPLLDGGGTLLLGSTGNYIGPGQVGIMTQNGQDLMSYHYYNGSNSGTPAFALQDLYWTTSGWPTTIEPMVWNANASGATPVDGGGTWNLTSTNFQYNASSLVWNNSGYGGVTFGSGAGAAGVVTLAQNVITTSITFNAAGSGNYAIAGGAGGYSINLSTGATITANVNATISAVLVGGALTKMGSATLTLSNANTYSGDTSVNGGSLIVLGSIAASNSILVGNISGVGAAMYQAGGIVTNTNAALGGFQLGSTAGAAGYYNLSRGTLNVAGEIDPGGSGGGAGTFGEFDMTGGTVNLPNSGSSYFLPNRGSAGEISVVNIMGGKVQIAGGGTPTDNGYDGLAVNWSGSGAGQAATITIANGGQFLTPSLNAKLNFGDNSANITTLNLGANGTLQTLGFSNGTSNNANVTVNFSGGTLMAGTAANSTFLQNLGAVYIYGNGGTINNNGQSITIAQPISSPKGLGVSGVNASGGSGYVVPPQVGFSGGGGSGASGYATINSSTGAVTSIVITNPGTGYTSSPSVTLTADGGGSGATVGAVATANNSGGTLTFLGSGITTLSGVSSDTGNAAISAGTVDLTGASASKNITVAAGAKFSASGNVNNGLATTANLTVDGSVLLAGSPTVSGPTALTLGSISIGAAGEVAVADPGLSNHGNRTVLVTSGLTIAGSTNDWTGKMDLAGNDMIVQGGSLATITNQVASGYAGGTFTGAGITSSTAAANTTHLTALGVIQNNQSSTALFAASNPFDGIAPGAGDVLMKYTYYGDANLSGTVDASDYSLIDNGYLNNLTGWFNGDFNYDGVVNGSDYTLIDNAFNMQGASLAIELAEPTATIAAQVAPVSAEFGELPSGLSLGVGDSRAVPEPALLAPLLFAVTPLLGRRRRQPGRAA